MRNLHLFFFVLFSTAIFAQSPESTQIEAMKKFDWLVGEWEGMAWTQMGPSGRDTVYMNETITKALNGTILQIKGTGYHSEAMRTDDVVHDAFAVIYFDLPSNAYKWQSWRVPGGYTTTNEPEVTENGFSWIMETPQGKMKYKLALNEKGQWFETGHFSSDGDNWFPFFEMTLNKVK